MKKDLLLTVFLTLIPNLLPIAASIYIGYERGFIGIEFLLIQIIVFTRLNWLAIIIGAITISCELIYGISQAYPLFETNQLLEVIQFIPAANKTYVLLLLLVYIQYITIFFIQKTIVTHLSSKKTALSITLLLILLINIPWLNNFEKGGDKIYLFQKQSPFGSVFFDLQDTWRFNGVKPSGIDTSYDFSPWIEKNVEKFIWTEKTFPKKILFIIMESWGLPNNIEEYKHQVATIKQNQHLKVLHEGVVKYGGGTVTAELRELCDLYPSSLSFNKVPVDKAVNCLPQRLKNLGYQTFSLHGASAQMYNRASWYPSIGLDTSYFLDTPLKIVSKCYSFPGFCDVDLFEPVGDLINNNEKIFIYWLTLNSHIPYDSRDIKNRDDSICINLNIKSIDRCIHFQLIKEFLDGISKNFGNNSFQGLEIILVGDHSPPFIKKDIREFFSPKREVPYLHLQII